MRFRPLRSRAFWFGLLGLVFLLWGWWMSMGHVSYAGFGGAPPWKIGQRGGEVYVIWNSDGWPGWRGFDAGHHKVSMVEVRQRNVSLSEMRDHIPNLRFVFFPYHWPLICYLAAWAGLLVWRGRKFRNAMPAESRN